MSWFTTSLDVSTLTTFFSDVWCYFCRDVTSSSPPWPRVVDPLRSRVSSSPCNFLFCFLFSEWLHHPFSEFCWQIPSKQSNTCSAGVSTTLVFLFSCMFFNSQPNFLLPFSGRSVLLSISCWFYTLSLTAPSVENPNNSSYCLKLFLHFYSKFFNSFLHFTILFLFYGFAYLLKLFTFSTVVFHLFQYLVSPIRLHLHSSHT